MISKGYAFVEYGSHRIKLSIRCHSGLESTHNLLSPFHVITLRSDVYVCLRTAIHITPPILHD